MFYSVFFFYCNFNSKFNVMPLLYTPYFLMLICKRTWFLSVVHTAYGLMFKTHYKQHFLKGNLGWLLSSDFTKAASMVSHTTQNDDLLAAPQFSPTTSVHHQISEKQTDQPTKSPILVCAEFSGKVSFKCPVPPYPQLLTFPDIPLLWSLNYRVLSSKKQLKTLWITV